MGSSALIMLEKRKCSPTDARLQCEATAAMRADLQFAPSNHAPSLLRHQRPEGREAAFDAAELRVKHIDEAAAAISTRSVDALFKAMGAAGMSKSRASCLGAEIDERLSLETLTRLTDIVHVKSPTVAT